MSEYYNVTTNAGDAAIATAIANNSKLNITHVAFGDGNGSVPTPNKTRSTLVHEVHRQAVTKYTKHPSIANYIVIETIIPSNVGGFWIREMGIIADNVLISHGSHAPFFKVADPDGVSEYRLKFTQDVRDGSVVEIVLDESLIYASQAWVNENYIRRNELIDNLTTDDASKPLTAKQGKVLNDNKLDKTANAVSASKLQTARTISYSGAATGSFNFDGSANASCVLTLANSGVTANTYGSNILIPVITVNAKGLATVVSTQTIRSASTSQTGVVQLVDDLATDDASKALTAKQGKILNESKVKADGFIANTENYPAWNSKSGVYLRNNGESTDLIAHFLGYGSAGCLQFRALYGNSGLFYRTARDNAGFTKEFEQILTSASGNAVSATKLQTSRNIALSGAVSGSANFDGSGNIAIEAGIYGTYVSSNVFNAFRSEVKNTQAGNFLSVIRSDDGFSGYPQYGAGLGFGIGDTNAFLALDYGNKVMWVGGGTSDKIAWRGAVAFQDGNIATASKLQTPRNIALSGAVSGNANFDGSGNITINTTANNAIGVGQSWQDVTSSRARETTYFNSTGKPIQVLVSFPDSNNDSPRIQVLVDNLTIINHQYDSGGSYGSGQYSFIVPSGQTYRVNTPFRAVDPILWTELR